MRWLIVTTPTEIHAWPVDDGEPHVPVDESLINAARVLVGMPGNDSWVTDASGFDVQLTPGEPHPKLLRRATVGTLAQLLAVDPTLVRAHAAARMTAHREQVTAALRGQLVALSEAQLADVLADPDVAARITRTR